MTLNGFWSTIGQARSATEKLVEIPPWLIDHLSQKDEREIVYFGSHLQDCMHVSYDAKLWLGAVVLLGGCGDDTFADFRGWLIVQGREAFESALADPDSMAGLENFDGDYGYPRLFYMQSVPRRAFCKRVAGDPRDSDAGDRFESLFPLRKHPALKNEDLIATNEEAVKGLFPKLAARFPNGIRVEKLK